ncbi:MAG: hypothetical protein EZS28_024922, partial [Streblomastix strix]
MPTQPPRARPTHP